MTQDTIIVELEDILERLEIAADHCARQLLRQEEAQSVIAEADQKLKNLLPPDSTAFRIYDRSKRERTLWWSVTMSGYVNKGDCRNIEQWVEIVRNIINEHEPEFLRGERRDKKQYFLSAGDRYRAMNILLKLMKRAQKSLAVVDEYLDEEVFDYINALNTSVNIQLITANQKVMFRKLYNALKTTRPNIEARECRDCHDRFLVIDGSEAWHLGTSINAVGKKASMISKVVDSDELTRLLSDFNQWWLSGTAV